MPAAPGKAREAASANGTPVPRPAHTYALLGALVGGVYNPYAGVMLASAAGGVPEPPAAGDPALQGHSGKIRSTGWLSSLAALFGAGAGARRTPQGVFEVADCQHVSGWAWDPEQPNKPILVTLFDGEQPVATALADQLRADVISTTQDDGRHGFRFQLPDSLRDGAAHTLSVRIQGTGHTLGSSPKTLNCSQPAYEGAITSADCEQVTGWAWDAGRPTTPVDVDVYVDGVFRARASADVYNAQLNRGDNRHQFSVPTPLAAKDGVARQITVRPAGSGQGLGSPASVTCNAPSYTGHVEGADCTYVTGWAWDSQRPNTPVSVDLYADGQFVTTTLADNFRTDLPGDGRHGYQIAIPDSLRNGSPHTYTARVSGGGPFVNGSAAATCSAQSSCTPAQSLASPEFVKNFYVGALARQPRPLELQYWNDALKTAAAQGQTALTLRARLLGRELFRQGEYAVIKNARPAAGKEEAYVSDLYWAYLQRGPDAPGQAHWANNIRSTPAGQDGWLDALIAFEGSDEFSARVSGVCAAPAESVKAYTAAGDFSPLQNPDAAWAYGYKPAGGSFTPFAGHTDAFGAGVSTWSWGDGSCCPMVTHNTTGSTLTYQTNPHIVQPPDTLNLHPGQNGERSVVRWTTPAAGTYNVAGRFQGLDHLSGTSTDVAVAHNGASIFTAHVNGGGAAAPFSVTRALAAGDTLEFSVGVGSNGTYNGDSTGLAVTVSPSGVSSTQPFGGAAAQVPGDIEAEHYDSGGEGLSYHDVTPGSHGQDYTQPPNFPPPPLRQPTDVDIYKDPGYGNSHLVMMEAGDWMSYTVEVAQSGTYALSAQTYFWNTPGGTFHVEADGVDVTGPLQLPGGNAWQTVTKSGVQLPAGRHVLRVVCDANGSGANVMGDIDFLRLTSGAAGDPGLRAHWKFDEAAGTTANDATGNGHTATLLNGPAWVGAKVGASALSFDGADDRLTTSNSSGVSNNFTVAFWANPEAAHEIDPELNHGTYGGSGQRYAWWPMWQPGGDAGAGVSVGTNGVSVYEHGSNFLAPMLVHQGAVSGWTHVAVVYENKQPKLYINGALMRTGLASPRDAVWAVPQDVGGNVYGFYDGQLDDVRLYNRPLSAAELGALAAAGSPDPTGDDFSEAKKDPANATGAGGDDPLSRNANFGVPLVGLKGRAGLDLLLSLSYNSLVWTRDAATNSVKFDSDYGDPSPGFRLGLPVIHRRHRNARGEQAYMLVTPSGGRVELRHAGSNVYEATDSSYLQLTEEPGGTLTLRPTDGSQLSFAVRGPEYKCTRVKDRNGNFITAAYNPAGNVSAITDTLGRVLTFAYDGNNRLQAVEQDRGGQTHRWATFGYDNLTVSAPFAAGVKVLGPATGTALSVLKWVSLQDGSRVVFSYNSWGQIYRTDRLASDGKLLSYTEYDLLQPTSAQTAGWTDCPRFTQRKDFVKDRNDDALALTTYSVGPNGERVVETPDGVKQKLFYAAANTWRRGLVERVETHWQNALRRTTQTTWTQDDETLAYQLNPRVKVSEVSDPEGNRTGTTYQYTSYGLPTDAYFWSDTASHVRRRTHTEYNLSPAYVTRRVIGLVGSSSVYDEQRHVVSKVDNVYDQGGEFLRHQGQPVQHDGENYGAAFVKGRGLMTSVRRWDVTALHDISKSVESRIGYNTTGSVILNRDPEGHQSSASYADKFSDKQGTNTLAYPTVTTDPGGFSSKVEYAFNTGNVTRAEDPKGAQQAYTYDPIGRLLRVEKSAKDAATGQVLNGGYTRWVYSDAMDALQTWTQVDAGKPEACSVQILDGAGGVRATASDFPGSQGGYRAQYVTYDAAGRASAQTRPTEVSGLWTPAGDDAAPGWKWTTQTFDWKGRTLTTTLPKRLNPSDPGYAAEQPVTRENKYEGCGCAGGEVSATRDEVGRRQRVTFDPLGRLLKSEVLFQQDKSMPFTAGADEPVYSTTTNVYNGLDRITEVRQKDNASGVTQLTTMAYDGHGRLWKRHTPEQDPGRETVFSYHADDQVASVTDARGAKAVFSYNSRHLTTSVSYDLSGVFPGQNVMTAGNVTTAYDAAGNRVSMTDGVGSATYDFDELSRLTSETRQFNGLTGSYTLSYAYNLAGALKSVADSSGVAFWSAAQVLYDHDHSGAVTAVRGVGFGNVSTFASGLGYRAWGGVKQVTYGNQVQAGAQYDGQTRLTRYELSNVLAAAGQQPAVFGSQSQHHADGRVSYARDLQNGIFDRAFSYDHAGRLKEAFSGAQARQSNTQDGPVRQSFSYDVWGNMGRTGRTWGTIISDTPSYTNNRRPVWGYDADGRVTGGPLKSHDYDAAGRQAKFFEDTFFADVIEQNTILQTYGDDGRPGKRVETRYRDDGPTQTTTVTTTFYLRSSVLGGEAVAEINEQGLKRRGLVYVGGQQLAVQETENGPGAVTWRHVDAARGSYIETATNRVATRRELDPLGAAVGTSDPFANFGGSYSQLMGSDALYVDMGNPFDMSGGCRVDGMAVSCSMAMAAVNSGAAAIDSTRTDMFNLSLMGFVFVPDFNNSSQDHFNPSHVNSDGSLGAVVGVTVGRFESTGQSRGGTTTVRPRRTQPTPNTTSPVDMLMFTQALGDCISELFPQYALDNFTWTRDPGNRSDDSHNGLTMIRDVKTGNVQGIHSDATPPADIRRSMIRAGSRGRVYSHNPWWTYVLSSKVVPGHRAGEIRYPALFLAPGMPWVRTQIHEMAAALTYIRNRDYPGPWAPRLPDGGLDPTHNDNGPSMEDCVGKKVYAKMGLTPGP